MRRYRNTPFNRWTMLILSLAIVFIGVWSGISAVRAKLGDGTDGYFVASSLTCGGRGGCSWHGSFENSGTVVAASVTYQGGTSGIYPGSQVPAIYESGTNAAYPFDSNQWLYSAAACVVGIGGIAFAVVRMNRARSATAAL
ncbi:MAG TPA: hypothetical protein VME44_28650 [Streptosporangiaceae bacterium]|nr:hypothetical protein [Streptosporangiaceae bacterium]